MITKGVTMAGLRDSTLKALERDLGRNVSQEEGSCSSYREVYDLHINDVRKLAPLDADRYIRYLLGGSSIGNAKLFTYFVAKEGMDIDHWMENYYEKE